MTPDHPLSETERTAVLLQRTKARGRQLKARRRHVLTGATVGIVVILTAAVVIPTVVDRGGRPPVGRRHQSATAPPSTTTPPAHATFLARGVQAPVSTIPWSQVGPGWTLATWGQTPPVSPGAPLPAGAVPFSQETVTLFLVNPVGGRYAITSFPPGTVPDLESWSGDGRRALLITQGTGGAPGLVTEVDLTTGATVGTFPIDSGASISYTQPDGLAIVESNQDPGQPILERLDRQGTSQLVYPSTFTQVGTDQDGTFLSTPDGTEIVIGASGGLALVGNDGTVVRQFPMSGYCQPRRWWSPGVVLADCASPSTNPDAPTIRLWLIPTSGAAATPFEAADPDPGIDLGDLNGWSVRGTTFVQATGPCGKAYVAQLHGDGTTAPVTIPGADNGDSEFIKGTYGDLLAVQATLTCGPGEALIWFNPTADTSNLILGPPLNGGGVIDAIVFPDAGS